jgi:hypothetical protein
VLTQDSYCCVGYVLKFINTVPVHRVTAEAVGRCLNTRVFEERIVTLERGIGYHDNARLTHIDNEH